MTPYKKRMNPFIQRMVGDMQLRNLADATIDAYTYHVDKFCQFFGKPADQLGPEEIRQYQLYLVNEKKVSWSSFNQAVCGLRFLYEITLQRPWAVRHIPFFSGKTPDVPLSSATIQKAYKLALAKAGIQKAATPHTMRHSWATAMLEAGVDLLTISKLLGHSSFITTMIYLHVRRQHFDRSPSPKDGGTEQSGSRHSRCPRLGAKMAMLSALTDLTALA